MFTLTNDTMLVGLLVRFLEVSSAYIDVKQSGKELTTCCPFQDDNTLSLQINMETKLWNCFGGECKEVFRFVMLQERIGFPEAIALLSAKTGLSLPSLNTVVATYNYIGAVGQPLY